MKKLFKRGEVVLASGPDDEFAYVMVIQSVGEGDQKFCGVIIHGDSVSNCTGGYSYNFDIDMFDYLTEDLVLTIPKQIIFDDSIHKLIEALDTKTQEYEKDTITTVATTLSSRHSETCGDTQETDAHSGVSCPEPDV